jgi:hypothetical protein
MLIVNFALHLSNIVQSDIADIEAAAHKMDHRARAGASTNRKMPLARSTPAASRSIASTVSRSTGSGHW